MPAPTFNEKISRIIALASNEMNISVEDVRELMSLISQVFTEHLVNSGFDRRQIVRLTTKLRDAGRRSPPWKVFSSRLPGRPQDGADGNRTSRWLLDPEHKFHANEIEATLVEIKYYLQCLSLQSAPALPNNTLQNVFLWLTGHPIEPGQYIDPIQRIPIDIHEVIDDASSIQSGHIVPLDRGGRHNVPNTFLMLKRSNALQGNLTVEELLNLMESILHKHGRI